MHITNLGKVAGAIDILTEVKASEALIQIVNKGEVEEELKIIRFAN